MARIFHSEYHGKIGGDGLISESLVVQLILVNFLAGLVVGWCVGYVLGCRKRGDYTK